MASPAPNFFLNDAPRPLVDGLRRAHDATIEEQFQQDFAVELPTYPPPAASVAALDDATRYLPEEERRAVDSALDYAARAHEGQRRKSGEAYVTHPIAVACCSPSNGWTSTRSWRGPSDTVEDTSDGVPSSSPSPFPPLALTPPLPPQLDDVRDAFGATVATIVAGVTDGERRAGAAVPAAVRRAAAATQAALDTKHRGLFSRWRRSGASSW